MNEPILDLMTKVTLYDLIWSMLLIASAVAILISQRKRVSKLLNKWRKARNDEEDFHSLVYEMNTTIKTLSDEVKQNQKNRDAELLRYRDDSRKIREEMYKVMDKQSEEIKSITKIIKEMQERDSKTKRAEIKEKIERIYRECHSSMECTDMQFEVLKEFIEEYEEHGGVNSFVHSTVESEMYEWKIINKIKEE